MPVFTKSPTLLPIGKASAASLLPYFSKIVDFGIETGHRERLLAAESLAQTHVEVCSFPNRLPKQVATKRGSYLNRQLPIRAC
jgi:hypothetical protein